MEQFIYIQAIVLATLFLAISLFLWLRAEGEKTRKILSVITLLWGLLYIYRLILHYPNGQGMLFGLFAPPRIISLGVFYIAACIIYLFEMVRPGWITWRRLGYMFAPWASVSAFYFATLYILQQPIRVITSASDFWQYMGEFNVWFRIPIFAMNISYLYIIYRITTKYNTLYQRWCSENFSATENMDISWLKYISIGFIITALAYMGMLFNGSGIYYIIHQGAILATFAFAFYKGLYHTSPYSDTFFKQALDEASAEQEDADSEQKMSKEDSSFIDNLASYRDTVEHWFVEKEPYLRKDLKLLDVGEVLPLNRSYLSRVFNEGFGQSFSLVVQEYRINKAKEIMRNGTKRTLTEVSSICGFASTSAFYSAFTKHVGATPKHWREVEVRMVEDDVPA